MVKRKFFIEAEGEGAEEIVRKNKCDTVKTAKENLDAAQSFILFAIRDVDMEKQKAAVTVNSAIGCITDAKIIGANVMDWLHDMKDAMERMQKKKEEGNAI